MKLCRPGGWIGWHDFHGLAWWRGLTRALRLFHTSHPGIRLISGTTIAVLEVVDLTGD
jgi:hypothetical protein